MTTEERDQGQEEVSSGSSSTGRRRRKATAQSEEQVSAQATPAETEDEKPKAGRRRKKSAEPVAEPADVDTQATESEAVKPKATRRRKKTTEPVAEQAATEAPAADAESAKPKTRQRRKSAAEPAAEQAAAPAVETEPAARATRRRKRAEEPAVAEAPQPPKAVQPRPLPRLLERLRAEIAPVMMREFGYKSPMQVPGLSKIVLNIGLGEALLNPRAMENASKELGMISGQRPVTTRAKKSIAGFKIREGMPIGTTVTLRGRRMYEFMDRLVSSTLPRIRDFRGVSREAFDGRGNYSLGIREQVIFPEIDYSSIDRIRGLQVVIGTTARTDSEGLRLLELMGMPFASARDAERVA